MISSNNDQNCPGRALSLQNLQEITKLRNVKNKKARMSLLKGTIS